MFSSPNESPSLATKAGEALSFFLLVIVLALVIAVGSTILSAVI